MTFNELIENAELEQVFGLLRFESDGETNRIRISESVDVSVTGTAAPFSEDDLNQLYTTLKALEADLATLRLILAEATA